MALANGDIVTMATWSLDYIQPQRPYFGKVVDSAGIDILWEDGKFEQGFSSGLAFDVLHDPTTTTDDLIGKVVRVTVATYGESPAFDAVVIACYRRQNNGNGDPGDTRCLVRLISNGMYLEVAHTQSAFSELTRLDNR